MAGSWFIESSRKRIGCCTCRRCAIKSHCNAHICGLGTWCAAGLVATARSKSGAHNNHRRKSEGMIL